MSLRLAIKIQIYTVLYPCIIGVRLPGEHDDARPARQQQLVEDAPGLQPAELVLQDACSRHGAGGPAAGDRHDHLHHRQRPAGTYICLCTVIVLYCT